MYLPVRLFICHVSSFKRKKLLIAWICLRWNCGRVSPSTMLKGITRSWYLGPSTPSWGLMENTTATIKSNPLSRFMLVMSLTCYFGALEEGVVSFLARWTRSDLENYWWLYFAVYDFGWVYGMITKEDSSWWFSVGCFYAIQLLFFIEIRRRQN